MPPVVSVVIPTYNQLAFLPRALDSVRAQTFTEYEMIVVDDASTDETPKYLARQPDVRVLRNPTNVGPSASRNAGWRAAVGQYVTFLDGDDVFLPNKLEWQAQALDADETLGFVYADVQFCDTHEVNLPWRISDVTHPHPGPDIFSALVGGNFISVHSPLIRVKCLRQVGGFDETLRWAEDWHLWLRLSADYPVRYLPQVLAKYRVHESNTSQRRLNLTYGNAVVRRWLIASPLFTRLAPKTRYACFLSVSISLAKLGQLTEARQMLTRAQHTLPGHPGAYSLWLLTWLGEAGFRNVIDHGRRFLEWVRGRPQPFGLQAS